MNPMNNVIRNALNKSLSALYFLDDAGATAVDIEVRGGRPVIHLDQAPPRFILGALHKSRTVGSRREHVMVASVQGCQVEWTVHTTRSAPGLAVEA